MTAAGGLLALAAAASSPVGGGDPQKYFYEEIFIPFFAQDPDRPGWIKNHRPGSPPSSFSARKPAGTLRVFLVGGSIAGTLAYLPRGLGEALTAVLPGRSVELIPCGMGGYDSAREAMVLQEVLEYEPDLIVLLTGHNERLGSPPVPIWIYKTGERLRRWDAFRKLAARLAPIPSGPESLEREAAKRDEAFERNLAANLREPIRRGAAVAVISPPLNYRDAPPGTPLPLDDPAFLRAFLAFLRGDRAVAGPLFQDFADGPRHRDDRAKALFFLAQCLEGSSPERALEAYRKAIDSGLGDSRCSSSCQETIRRAAAREGAVWVDVDGAFLRDAAPGLPGIERFEDGVHWRAPYNRLVSLEIARALASSPRLASWPWDAAALRSLEERWRRPEPGWEEASYRNTLKYARSQLHPQLNWMAIYFLKGVHERYPGWFEEREPSEWRLQWHYGAMLTLLGRFRDARAILRQALKAAAAPVPVSVSLALAEAAAGDRLRAVARARKILEQGARPPGREERTAQALVELLELDRKL